MDHRGWWRSALRGWPLLAAVAAAGLAASLPSPEAGGLPGGEGQPPRPGAVLWGLLIILGALLLRHVPAAALAVLLLAVPAWAFTDVPHHVTATQMLPAAVGLIYLVATRPRRLGALAAMLAFLAMVVVEYGAERGPVAQTRALPLVVAAALSWLIGDLIRQNREQAALARVRAGEQAVTAERLRIARELHDLVAHSIGIIAIQAGAGRRVIASRPEAAEEALAAIEATSRETLSGLRRALIALREAGPDESTPPSPLAPAPGLTEVAKLATVTGSAGVRVDVEWHGERLPLPADIDLSAFRIVQEAVTNVVRHAATTSCTVHITFAPDSLELEVVDRGRGLPAAAGVRPGFGLTGMRERVSLLRGSFEAGPRPEGGFRVWARLPLEAG